MQNLLLVKFEENLSYAHLIGLFTITTEKLQLVLDDEPRAYLGECAGKHSEVERKLSAKNLTVISDDINFIKNFQSKCGLSTADIGEEGLVFGIDPISHLEEQGFFE